MTATTRILIIDHDQLSRKLLTEVLSDMKDVEFIEASSVASGIEALQDGQDLSLVIVDPIEASAHAWQMLMDLRETLPTIPIIVLSTPTHLL